MSALPQVRLGALVVSAQDRPWEGAEEVRPVDGLRITLEETGDQARYNAATGRYGLQSARVGAATLLIEDPRGAWLPQRAPLTLPDSVPTARALARGERPAWSPLALSLRLCVGPRQHVPEGQTRIWGELRDVAGQPAPYALLGLELGERRWVGGSDATGRYQLWPRGLPWRDETTARPEWVATLRVAQALDPSQPPWSADLDAMAQGQPDTQRYAPQRSHPLTLRFGASARLDPDP